MNKNSKSEKMQLHRIPDKTKPLLFFMITLANSVRFEHFLQFCTAW